MNDESRTSTRLLLAPTSAQWSALPLRRSQRFAGNIATAIVASTVLGIFLGFSHWSDGDLPSWTGEYRLLDMLGLSSISLILPTALFGWFFARYMVFLAPVFLGYTATVHTLDHSPEAPFWWLGAIFAVAWALYDFGSLVHQTRRVAELAQNLRGRTTIELTEDSRDDLRFSAGIDVALALVWWGLAAAGWWWTFSVFAEEEGATAAAIEETSSADFIAAASVVATSFGLLLLLRAITGWWARSTVGVHAWRIPLAQGPLVDFGSLQGIPTGWVSNDPQELIERCVCTAELVAMYPNDAQEIRESLDVAASAHCPIHGIDAINSLSHEEFALIADQPWIWAAESSWPSRNGQGPGSTVVLGFTGAGFTGYYASIDDKGHVDTGEDSERAEEFIGQEIGEAQALGTPTLGTVDKIDLHAAGFSGFAVRYKHSRAWFVADAAATDFQESID